jgi:WD40 repeat protein
VLLQDVTTGELVATLLDGTTPVHDLSFAPDGAWLAAAGDDRTVLLWNMLELEGSAPEKSESTLLPTRRLEDHEGAVWAVEYSQDGRYLASASDRGRVHLRDASTLTTLITLEGDNRLHRSLSFSDDGRYLAVGCLGEPSITWDLLSLRDLLEELGAAW